MSRHLIYFLFLISILSSIRSQAYTVSLVADSSLLENNIAKQSIYDVLSLLDEACECTVNMNDDEARIRIVLPSDLPPFVMKAHHTDSTRSHPYFYYPEHGYTWNISAKSDAYVYELEATSYAGVSNGLYGLLQEKLGFAFIHPRETIIPDLREWPQPQLGIWAAKPRFEKKGFHLHTQHPLELTEQLMMLNDENWSDVKEYIDWLARNQQNYFEFNLLEGIDRQTWPSLAARMVDYLHSRGIIAGLDLSLHMTQQKSFMLYLNPPNSLLSKEKQIRKNVELLFEADWDVWNVEFSTTEFTSGNIEKKKKLQALLNKELKARGAKLMGRQHVVKEEEMLGASDAHLEAATKQADLDAHRGVMSHTVMFYTAFEEIAPVYGNENLKHMLEFHEQQQQERETWYYPESAYWITFDISVPMLLLPYLQARLDDILGMQELGTQGHLTFSSGWEWGYWLVDWSIARWSWEFSENGEKHDPHALQYLDVLTDKEDFKGYLHECNELHQSQIKDNGLIHYLTAQTVTDELPEPLDLQLHPRPDWRYGWLMNASPLETVQEVANGVLPRLENFFSAYDSIKAKYDISVRRTDNNVEKEIIRALDVVALRAKHRYYTILAIASYRGAAFNYQFSDDYKIELTNASAVREQALELVREQEGHYRYSMESLTTRRWDHTYCHFGYLYTVHDLHYWEREELQIKKNRWGPLFMNIWNIPRTIGLID